MFLPLSPVLSILQFPSAQVPWIGNYKIDKTGDSGKNIFYCNKKMKNNKTKNVSSTKQCILNNIFPTLYIIFITCISNALSTSPCMSEFSTSCLVGYKCRENEIYKLHKKHTQNKYIRKKSRKKTFYSAL